MEEPPLVVWLKRDGNTSNLLSHDPMINSGEPEQDAARLRDLWEQYWAEDSSPYTIDSLYSFRDQHGQTHYY
jgi:hypothetical protein